jgi:O-antigen ligase
MNIVAVKDEVGITLGRSNYVASILLMLIPLSIAALPVESGKKRWLKFACCIVMILGLASTLSRGALAAECVGLAVCLPLMFRAGLKFKHLLAGAAVLGLVYLLLPSDILSANTQLYELKFANSDARRLDLMRETWMDFQANPLLGVGPGQLPTWIELHAVEYQILGMNAHNLVLNALGEMGVLGGVPLLLIVGLLLVRVWRNAWTCKTPLAVALCVSFTAVLLHNMVEASFEGEQFQIVFWIIAALVPPGDELQQIRNASPVTDRFIGALSRGRGPLTV